MCRLHHPNVLHLHDMLATRSKKYLIMELAHGGDLFSKLASLPSRRLPKHAAWRVFLQLISALIYYHMRGVSHRDVTPQNMLLDADDNLKTPAFVTLEVLCRKAYYGAKANMWFYGVILFVLLTSHLPFDEGLRAEVTTGNDHAVCGAKEMSNADAEKPRDSSRSIMPSVKVQAIANNDHAMTDAQETRKPLLEQPWDNSLSIAEKPRVGFGV
ncbi:hypothetical protein GUJ93_ZPchr0011g28124 [Zizania palustris]|uniref:Protein kinase domain-containing protein n=1 Tax=Zizania palustris TaxID=103762 RepID=A0A8J5WKV3_ZIZPA|nr:hypothetical protein GUJ93_ZPchr0011g28124 [Zizania palustris]